MAASSTVDQAVVQAIITEATAILTNGGTMDVTLTLDGFNATISIKAQVAPDAPVLAKVK